MRLDTQDRWRMDDHDAAGRIPATLIPGDGIGPEIVGAAVEILQALGGPFPWVSTWAAWPASRWAAILCRLPRCTASSVRGSPSRGRSRRRSAADSGR